MAEINDLSGNIFLTACDVVTITVNCEGVMGAGIALEARLRWPEMFDAYKGACEAGELRPGSLFWWPEPPGKAAQLCFPTKDHWKQPSRLSYVRDGLAT